MVSAGAVSTGAGGTVPGLPPFAASSISQIKIIPTPPEGAPLRFTSMLPPPYLRPAQSIEELLPWLYLKGISTGDFSEALAALLGEAPGLSASTITRLKTD